MEVSMRKEKRVKGKRLLAVIVASALVLGAVPAGAPRAVLAAEEGQAGGEADQVPDGVQVSGTLVTSGTNFKGTTLDLRGTGITGIGERAFSGNKNLVKVYLPSTLESIGGAAFKENDALSEVVFEEDSKLASIGYEAFYQCDSLTTFYLPDSVKSIGSQAFYWCNSLSSFVIGENSQLETIASSAFAHHGGGQPMTGKICFPSTLRSIAKSAFYGGAKKLSVVEFKNKDTELEGCGLGCETMVFLSEPGGKVEQYARDNGYLFNRPSSSFAVKTSDGKPLEFFYGDLINSAVLELEGVTATAKFITEPDKDSTVNLSDCLLSGFDTKMVGEQNIRFAYSELSASIPIAVYYDMSTATVSRINAQTYTGGEIKPEFTVTMKAGETMTLREGTDYTVKWENNVNKGTATVTLTGKGRYKGTKHFTFEIEEQSIGSAMQVNLASETLTWTGKALEPAVSVFLGSRELDPETDYTVEYTNNVGPGTAYATVTCKGNYSGSSTKQFQIVRDIGEDMDVTIREADSLIYTGYELEPEVVVMLDGKLLSAYTDYTVEYKNSIMPGENSASVIITGTGLYTGKREIKFTILPKQVEDLLDVILDKESMPYTGEPQMPKVKVKMGDYEWIYLKEGTDYTLTYADNTEVGTVSVTVTCKGIYAGQAKKNFTITPLDISKDAVVSLEKEEFEYTGEEFKPAEEVTIGEKKLVSGTDYTVEYKNNIQPGSAEVEVTGKGNYSGTVVKSFEIYRDFSDGVKLSFVENELEFTGAAVVPVFTVTWEKMVLVPEKDYDVSYKNNINVGTATVTVTGKGEYRGKAEAEFTITKRDIVDEMDCILAYDEIEATGGELKPGVTVRLGNKTLIEDHDYTVEYADNIEPGTATVTVTAKGNYEGTAVLNFTIKKAAAVTPGPSETEKPEEKPDVTETEKPGGATDPSQPGHVTPGTPSASSSPSGPSSPSDDDDADDGEDDEDDAFSGGKAGKVKNLKAKNDKKKSVTLTWAKVPKAKSYQVQYSTSKKFKGKKTKVAGKAKITLKGMKKKKTYYFKVRACTNVNGKKVYGAWSAVKKVKIRK